MLTCVGVLEDVWVFFFLQINVIVCANADCCRFGRVVCEYERECVCVCVRVCMRMQGAYVYADSEAGRGSGSDSSSITISVRYNPARGDMRLAQAQ